MRKTITLLLVLLAACGDDAPANTDSGAPIADAGSTSDGGSVVVGSDAGSSEADAGAPVVDGGTPEVDGGAPSIDAGPPEADAGFDPDVGRCTGGMIVGEPTACTVLPTDRCEEFDGCTLGVRSCRNDPDGDPFAPIMCSNARSRSSCTDPSTPFLPYCFWDRTRCSPIDHCQTYIESMGSFTDEQCEAGYDYPVGTGTPFHIDCHVVTPCEGIFTPRYDCGDVEDPDICDGAPGCAWEGPREF